MGRKSNLSFLAVLIFLSSMFIAGVSFAGEITPALKSALESFAPDEEIPVIVKLADRVDPHSIRDADKKSRRMKILLELKDRADRTQSPLKSFLESRKAKKMKPLWIINAVSATVPASLVNELAGFPGVESVNLDFVIHAPEVTFSPQAAPQWNITRVKATDLWGLGHTGLGIVVANMDSGVDFTHPDLIGRWRGGSNSWFNPYSQPANSVLCKTPGMCTPCELANLFPCDAIWHGTATMGIMVGGSASGSSIGVAPGARWIAVKIFNDAGAAASSVIHSGFQWLLDPDNNPLTDDAPDVVNNSWGAIDPDHLCHLDFADDIQALRAAGIAVVFSAGNDGPNSSTSLSPANNAGAFPVGATDNMNNIAPFSSRGPSACSGGIFPDVVAPGLDVVTSFPSSRYVYARGTSFAAPHVAGAMALLLDAFPAASITNIEMALKLGAVDLGSTGADNNFGYGLIDIKKAYDLLLAMSPVISLTPSSGDYGAVELAGAAPIKSYTITNYGLANLTIGAISVSGADAAEFVKQADSCSGQTLTPASSCVFDILFSRASLGTKTALINIPSNDPVSPALDIALSATVWTSVPGGTFSALSIAWNQTNSRIHIAGRGMDDLMYLSTLTAGGLFNNDWTKLPVGATPDALGITWNPINNKLHIAARGMDDGIYLSSVDANMGSFSGWTRLIGGIPSALSIAWNPTNSKLHIAARGMDDGIYLSSVDANMGSFIWWTRLIGGIPDPLSISWNDANGKLYIAARGMDDGIYLSSVDANMGSFSGWIRLIGGIPSSPAITWSAAENRLYIVARGFDDRIYWGTVDSNLGSFSGWTKLPVWTTISAPGAVWNQQSLKLNIIIRRPDNTIAVLGN